MLQSKQAFLSFKENHGFMLQPHSRVASFLRFDASSEEKTEPDAPDAPLDDAAQSEREYVRQRLREELKREPSDEELDEWLRQHTEGY